MIDLHSHSIHSDGTHTPSELIYIAKEKGITTYAITDHDNIEGSKQLIESHPEGITVYSGVELNAKVSKGQMHILGYNFDLYNENLNNKLKELKENSKSNIMLYVNQLKNDFNIVLPETEINDLLNREGNIGRPMLALLLIKYNHVQTVAEAFDKYLMDDKVRNHKLWITKEECIKLILDAGGIPVLAHPWSLKLTNEELEQELQYLVKIGLKGIEVIHSKNTVEERTYYHKLALKYNLLETGGTDFHGKQVKPDIELGTGINDNVCIADNSLNFIKEVSSRY